MTIRLLHPLLAIPASFAILLFVVALANTSLAADIGHLFLLSFSALIVIAAWRAGHAALGDFFACLAIGFLGISLVQLVYVLARSELVPQMFVEPFVLASLASGTRFLEGMTLLCAPYFITHRLPRIRALAVVAVLSICTLLYSAILPADLSPEEGSVLPLALDIAIALQLVVAFVLYYTTRNKLPSLIPVFLLLAVATLLLTDLFLSYGEMPALATHLVAYWLILIASVRAVGELSVHPFNPDRSFMHALSESEARRRATFEHAGIGIGVCSDGTLVECNAALLAFFEREESEVIGRDIWTFIHPDDCVVQNGLFVEMNRVSNKSVTRCFRYLRPGGDVVWGETTLSPIFDVHDELRFVIGMVVDITERKRAEEVNRQQQQALLEARRTAEDASAAKTRFLAAASHDLRQPIQAIHLLLHLVRSHTLVDETRTVINRIGGAVDGLSNMLDTLLDISKLDAGLVVPEREGVALGPLMTRVVSEYEPLATAKGLQLRTARTSLHALTDAKLLERILGNLLSNAVKYTQNGRILLGCRRRDVEIEIMVLDTGQGIPHEAKKEIFREFHQIGNKARDRREGLGLGLAIVERLCGLLNHRIVVNSEIGKGSAFSIFIPVAQPKYGRKVRAGRQLALPVSVNGASLLLVDDEEDIRDGLFVLCTQWGYQVYVARDEAEAMTQLKGMTAGPDILLVDYRLPDSTGLDLVMRVRRRFRRRVAAIILTGDAANVPLQETESSGIEVLHKPVAPNLLRVRLAQQLLSDMRYRRR